MPELRNVSFEVDGKKILNNISLTMEDNRSTMITGPSGGGKSTLAKLITGIEKPTEEEVLFDGEDITATSIDERVERKIGYAFQQPPRFKGMSVRRLLSLTHGKDLSEEICYSYLTDVELCPKDYLNRGMSASLPGGGVKRIEIVSILARDLKLSIFDEPGAGIDLWSFTKLVETFWKLQREPRQSIILISHRERTMQLADGAIIIKSRVVRTKGKRDGILPSLASEFDSCEPKKQVKQMEQMEKNLLKIVADVSGFMPGSVFSLGKNGASVERHSTEYVKILAKTDKPGTDTTVGANTVGESIHIPIILTDNDIQDMVHDDLYIGGGVDVEAVTGCGIHNDGCDISQHNGVYTFHIGRSVSITCTEEHYGEGSGSGSRILSPTTVVHMEEGSLVKTDIGQIKGVDSIFRETGVNLGASAKLAIDEKLVTHGEQKAYSDVTVSLNGEDSVVQTVSRSVGEDTSMQVFHPIAVGNNCFHAYVQCDSIIMGKTKTNSIPEVTASHVDVGIIHEAAIGGINDDQLIKLQISGLNSEGVEKVVVDGLSE